MIRSFCLDLDIIFKGVNTMELGFKELLFGWKRDAKNIVILIVLSAMGMFCIGIACRLLIQTEKQVKKYKEIYEDVQFCSILDNFVGDLEDVLEIPENKIKFNKFLNLLTDSEYFDYFMMYDQSVYIENYKGKENNIYGYEYNADLTGATSEICDKNGVIRECTNVKGFWIGDNVIEYFKLGIGEGRKFEKEEFILNPNKPIPIILGSNYASEYDVGDSLFVCFVFSESEATIIGFLDEDSNVYYHDEYINLDNYVIMPVFQNDDYEGKEIYNFSVNHFYTLRNSGVIASKLALDDIKEIIGDYSNEAGLDNGYYIVEYNDTSKTNFEVGIENLAFLICVIVVIIIIVMAMLISICIVNRINGNKRYYAILMLSGCSRMQVCNILLLEVLEIFLIGNLFAIILYISVIGLGDINILRVYNTLLYELILFAVLPCIVTMVSFFKNDLDNYLKGEIEYVEDR